MRGAGGTRVAGVGGTGNRDDLPTLRVTNISEDTQENDLRELFGIFGRVARVYVGRDRETGAGKGFAFVSFEERAAAQKAIDKVHGKGYDSLILSVQWSREWLVLGLFLLPDHNSYRASARAEMIIDRVPPLHYSSMHLFLLAIALMRSYPFICLTRVSYPSASLSDRLHGRFG